MGEGTLSHMGQPICTRNCGCAHAGHTQLAPFPSQPQLKSRKDRVNVHTCEVGAVGSPV